MNHWIHFAGKQPVRHRFDLISENAYIVETISKLLAYCALVTGATPLLSGGLKHSEGMLKTELAEITTLSASMDAERVTPKKNGKRKKCMDRGC